MENQNNKSICSKCYHLIKKGVTVCKDETKQNLHCSFKNISMNNLNVKSCNNFRVTEAARQAQIFHANKVNQTV